MDWLRSANEYCFGYGSPTTLGVIRIGVGFLALVNWLMIGVDWDSWFSERGFIPNWLGSLWFGVRTPYPYFLSTWLPQGLPRLNLLSGITDPRINMAFYAVVTISALFTCIGLGTRYAAFVLAIGTVTLHDRNGAILHGGDTVLRMLVIYIAVSPSGQACSLDRLIDLWKERISRSPVLISIWGQRLIAYNTALIYFTTLWLKWDGDKWRFPKMNATYYPGRLAEFYRFPLPDFMRSGWMARVTTIGTLITEFCLGTLVFFPPARKYVLIGGVLMHSYIEYSMNIPLFSFLMIVSYLSFYQGEEVTGWAQRMGMRLRKWHVRVSLPQGMRLQPRALAFFDAMDPFKMVTYLPGEGPNWTAEKFDGQPIGVSKAIGSRCIGGWVFLWLPGMSRRLLEKGLEAIPTEAQRAEKSEPKPAGQFARKGR
ncbi:MAG TPA: HTTM domain-containing protein [Fimbriimonas sp.]|nr:HTTM domain-containing protein [Fimbriimonas sp.]